jgi:predicted nucleic acid-binding protein
VAIRAVIDTNIWISALLNPFGYPARIRKSFEKGVFQVVVSEPILEELADVINRPLPSSKSGQCMCCFQETLKSAGTRTITLLLKPL